jgi:excinuclease UvrABC ATPase subunit
LKEIYHIYIYIEGNTKCSNFNLVKALWYKILRRIRYVQQHGKRRNPCSNVTTYQGINRKINAIESNRHSIKLNDLRLSHLSFEKISLQEKQ